MKLQAVKMLDIIHRDYKARQIPNTSQTSQQSQHPALSKKAEKPVPLYKRFLNAFTNTNVTNNNELKLYFSEPVICSESSVLDYWKENSERFPILCLIAKDYLSIMPTSVASERSFSLAGLTITDIRFRLDPNTANETLCLSSWQKLLKSLKL
jgi:hypothetical protein